jgi:predicted DNA-binding transcriptional regulator YafY
MKDGPSGTRLRRILTLVTEIRANPCQPVERLLNTLGIGRSQFYNDRKLLEGLGFKFARENGCFVVKEEAWLPAEGLSLSDRLALLMAVRQLAASGESYLSYQGVEAARKLIASLDERWREATRDLFDDFILREGFGCDPQILNVLQQASLEQRRVEIDYLKPDSRETGRYEFEPYFVYFQNRSMYADGYCPTRKDFRTFKAARIKNVRQTAIRFRRRSDFDFSGRHRGTFAAFTGPDEAEVAVRFSPGVKRYIEETLWHHTQRTKELEGGYLELRVRVAEPREVMWWAFSWGDGAEILEPAWLRQEARGIIQRMARLYEGGEG